MSKEIGKIYETFDYEMFKHLEGNRTDAEKRGARIIDSIRTVGYILSPIAVNEKYEVIDGQGRLYALRHEGLPVHYFIVCGAGIEECIAMNIYGTKWKIDDYVESYAGRGNMNYITFNKLLEKYRASLSFNTVLQAVTMVLWGSNIRKEIMKGKLVITEDDYKKAVERLDYCMKVSETVKRVSGRKDFMYSALMFIHDYYPASKVDKAKLLTKLELQWNSIAPIADVNGALKSLSDIYNFRSRSEPMRFDVDYDKYMCEKVPGYSGKWSRAKK